MFTALKVVPLLGPEYGEAAMAIDAQLGQVSIGLQAAPYIANSASNIAQKVDNVLPFGSVGDLRTTSRFNAAEQAFKQIPEPYKSSGRQPRWGCSVGTSENIIQS